MSVGIFLALGDERVAHLSPSTLKTVVVGQHGAGATVTSSCSWESSLLTPQSAGVSQLDGHTHTNTHIRALKVGPFLETRIDPLGRIRKEIPSGNFV